LDDLKQNQLQKYEANDEQSCPTEKQGTQSGNTHAKKHIGHLQLSVDFSHNGNEFRLAPNEIM
jgi:hypothetical protein